MVIDCSSMSVLVMFVGVLFSVNVMLSLMSIARPPPLFCFLSCLIVVKPGIIGVLEVSVSFVSCIVMMSAL
jgi:hypothetical protein